MNRSSSAVSRRPGRLLEDREVQDDEDVVVVRVELRALVAGVDVLEVERVELEVLLEPLAVGQAGLFDVDPAEAGGLDDLRVGDLYVAGQDRATRDATAEARAWERQVRHRLGGFIGRGSGAILAGGHHPRPASVGTGATARMWLRVDPPDAFGVARESLDVSPVRRSLVRLLFLVEDQPDPGSMLSVTPPVMAGIIGRERTC